MSAEGRGGASGPMSGATVPMSSGAGPIGGGVGEAIPHESAHLHVSGEALYTDDLPLPQGSLHAAIGVSERAHARLRQVDLSRVHTAPGVVAVLTAKDIPG